MSIAATFLRLAKQVFLNLAVALILFFLPLDLLFRLNSWTLFMPATDMINQIFMMILLLALLSVGLALLVAGVGCALVGLSVGKTAGKAEETICAVVAMGSLAMILLFLLRTLSTWLKLVSGIAFTVGTGAKFLILLLIMVSFVVWAWKYGLLSAGNAIRSRLAKGIKLVLVLIVSAALVVATRGIALHDFNEIKTNPIPARRASMPNVILLSIDTLSAEDMSLYGYHLPTTPRLNAFAKASYVFDNFFSSSNWTTPTVASFISGLYPVTSGVHNQDSYFLEDDRKKNLGQVLKDNGYQTAAIVVNSNAHPLSLQISDSFSATTELPVRKMIATDSIYSLIHQYQLKNYRTRYWARDMFQTALNALKVFRNFSDHGDSTDWPPEIVFSRTIPFLSSPKQPSFIWSHILPPHAPYLPAASYKYKFGNFKAFSTRKDYKGYFGKYSAIQQTEVDQIRLRYDEFILDTDGAVGDFLDKLRAMGRFDDSIIIITADHGESFTKNYLGHDGPYLHQPLIHIPLMVRLPGQKEGKRIPFYADQVDLLPTVMDLLDLPVPKWVEGESLKAAMLEGKPTSLPKFSMNLDQDSRFLPPSKGTFAVMQVGWKLVRYLATGKEELYHLASDPGETTDLASSNPEQTKKMRDLIYARFKLGR